MYLAPNRGFNGLGLFGIMFFGANFCWGLLMWHCESVGPIIILTAIHLIIGASLQSKLLADLESTPLNIQCWSYILHFNMALMDL